MAANTFGRLFQITTFGESHGPGIGVVIQGCPAGLKLNLNSIQNSVDRRKPKSIYESKRKETDKVVCLSGVNGGKTTGAPLSFWVENSNVRTQDYRSLENKFRPSHADLSWFLKYNQPIATGGGRASARETVVRVIAGEVAKQLLSKLKIKVSARVVQLGEQVVKSSIEEKSIQSYLKMLAKNGDTCGGIIKVLVENCPAGLGEPTYNKLSAQLAAAMFSIPTVKGFEVGTGFFAATSTGSKMNDSIYISNKLIRTKTNHSGGIQAGISNGMPIEFSVAFKPISSIRTEQETITHNKKRTTLKIDGRHDVCAVPRALSIVEAMTYLVLADFYLLQRSAKL